MSFSVGIVGLPNVGKSTLFNAITKQQALAANYPFATIEPNTAIVEVPDRRLDALTKLSGSARTIPTAIEITDIAGLVAGAHQGEGLGNKFLSHIRDVDAIAHLVRAFEDDDIKHVADRVDPLEDTSIINTELILADLEIVAKRVATLTRDARGGDAETVAKLGAYKKIEEALAQEQFANTVELSEDEQVFLRETPLLTMKPMFYVLNVKENELEAEATKQTLDDFEKLGRTTVVISVKIEQELSQLSDEDKALFIQELGLKQSGLADLVTTAYKALNLITFLTTGEDETRAWTVPHGSSAPRAGRAIHSDFEARFIRAEVVFWKDLVKSGSYPNARAQGLVRTEGRDYIVVDGDVVEFKV